MEDERRQRETTATTGRSMVLVLILMGCVAGCGLFGSDPPTEARLRIEGTSGARATLVVSANFLSQRQAVFDENGLIIGDTLLVQLIEADTLEVGLPFEQRYDISAFHQFFAHIRRHNPGEDGLLARLWIDGRLRSEQQPTAGQDSVIIVYNFRGRVIEPDDDTL